MKKYYNLYFAVITCFGQFGYAQVRSNALDASPQIGSGGINSSVQQYRSGYGMGGYGNLYITGNITAGKQFRGFVPYSDSSQFQGRLGSSALNTFDADAPGLNRILGGYSSNQSLPYYSPNSTMLPLSAQRQGLNIPGSSSPRAGAITPLQLFQSSPLGLQRPTIAAQENRLPDEIQPSDILIPSVAIPGKMRLTDDYTRPISPGAVEKMGRPAEEPSSLQPLKPKEVEQPATPDFQLEQQIMQQAQQQIQESQTPPMADFTDWLKIQADRNEPAPSGNLFRQDTDAANRMAAELNRAASRPAEEKSESKQLQSETKWGKTKIPVLLTTLAGNTNSLFDQTMRTAQKRMIQGKYFEAWEIYTSCLTIKENDPLPIFGQANAMIAAGEFRTASDYLRQGLAAFPNILNLRFSGQKLFGSKLIFDRRNKQILEISAKSSEPDVLLIKGYMELLSGNNAEAIPHINQGK